jgi:MoxR-like ATPase
MQDPNTPNNQNPLQVPQTGGIPSGNGVVVPSTTPTSGGNSSAPVNPAGNTTSLNGLASPVAPMAQSGIPGSSPSPVSQPSVTTGTPSATTKDTPVAGTSKPTSDTAGKKPEEKKEAAKNGEPDVKKVDIEKVVSNWTGIPITKLTEDEGAKLLNLEKRIHQRLIDQEEAVTAVAEAVRRGRIGLAAANRPIASFIFLGPSGTGKTELAKTVAEILFGKDDAMVRLDMSEYMEKHEVAKLIGAPPGYVGYEEGGQLTEAVRAKPYSIVLLDEVEKAHPDVFNILLQLLEDGRLTDNKGNTISFKNTIVICTSNIGSALITQKLGEKDGQPQTPEQVDKAFEELTGEVSAELHKFFRPELLNRFDDIVIFKPLRRQDMAQIAKLGIEKTGKLLKEQDIKIQITDKALAQLALEGYDPVYGARPLRRLIQTSIENPIAVLLIAKTFVAGDTILIDYDASKADYSFRKATPEDIATETKKKEEDKEKQKKEMAQITTDQKQSNTQSGISSNSVSQQNASQNSTPSPAANGAQNQQTMTPPGIQKPLMANPAPSGPNGVANPPNVSQTPPPPPSRPVN